MISILFASTAGSTLIGAEMPSQSSPRKIELFDFGWKFFKGDASGAEQAGFDDSSWQKIDIPHDWSIEGPFDENNPGKAAFGYLPGGVGWYRKSFQIPAGEKGKKVFLKFDGIYENSKVWINGKLLGQQGYGFSSFEHDLTPYLKFGGSNTLAIRAENLNQPNCRWYSGSGIYRHAWLTITDPLHVVNWGIYVTTPVIEEGKASVRIRTRIRNESDRKMDFSLESKVFDNNGKEVSALSTRDTISGGETKDLQFDLLVEKPRLWSPESPEMHVALSRIISEGNPVDEYTTPFGIRSIRYEKGSGFILNGKPVKMKGVCVHADGGSVGAAVPAGVWERRLRTLKEIGCNAIRCSHNPPAPEFLDLCDRLGFLVIDEAFDKWQYENARYFAKGWKQDLVSMLERDRNHPSIVLWSVGNENGGVWTEKHFETYKKLSELVHKEEPTRPVTAALRPFEPPKDNPTKEGLIAQLLPMVKVLDVPCLNYQEHLFEELHKAAPDIVLIASETHLYYRGEGTKYKSDNDDNPWFDVEKNDYVAGQFLWTGIDYLGESEGWPAKGKANSIMETTGFRKDCSYWFQSVWSDKPMVHIAVFDESNDDYPQKKYWQWPKIRSHWTFPGKENQTFKVATYSNCESVELLLNGKSLGRKKPLDFKNRTATWDVKYEPGEIKALGMNGDRQVAEWTLKTAGRAAKIRIIPDKMQLIADGQDVVHLEVRVEDSSGVLVPDAAIPLTFKLEGAGKLIGLDNGDLRSGESFKGSSRKTWRGRCLAIIQSGRNPAPVTIEAKSPGLPKTSLELKCISAHMNKNDFQESSRTSAVEWGKIKSPVLFRGDDKNAFRDPAAIFNRGFLYLYFTKVETGSDGLPMLFTAWSKSRDLLNWSHPIIFTPPDRNLNFSSPGSVFRHGEEWILCLQTYPRPRGERYGNDNSRLWIMRSKDLENWSSPELIKVKGPDVPPAQMGRMIDPFIFPDKDVKGKWWCSYKQNGMSLSWSTDMKTWTPAGSISAGENTCIIQDGDEYMLFHSPENGIGIKRSPDLKTWRDLPTQFLGQKEWVWAKGRLTAAFVIDLRHEPSVGRALMLFHGSEFKETDPRGGFDNFASIGIAWSDDLLNWRWPIGQ